MASARVSIGVDEAAPLRSHRFVSAAGEPVAWLHVGEERELHVYGSPEAMRRFGAMAMAAADAADELRPGRGALRVVNGS
jgi:hypothetical protein